MLLISKSKPHTKPVLLAALLLLACVLLQIKEALIPSVFVDWNSKEISRITVPNPDDFSFIVFGDSRGSHSIFGQLLNDVRHERQVAFSIDMGDMVNTGQKKDFTEMLRQVRRRIKIPFITTIGNHDLTKGEDRIYREVFGTPYYAFQKGNSYFIVLAAVDRKGIDPGQRLWLEERLREAQSSRLRFVFMHIPPFDPRGEGFEKSLYPEAGQELMDLFRRYHVTHLYAGHFHGYFSGTEDDIPYTISGGAGDRLLGTTPDHYFHHYVRVNVHDGKIEEIVRPYEKETLMTTILSLAPIDRWSLGLGIGAVLLLIYGYYSARQHKESHIYKDAPHSS